MSTSARIQAKTPKDDAEYMGQPWHELYMDNTLLYRDKLPEDEVRAEWGKILNIYFPGRNFVVRSESYTTPAKKRIDFLVTYVSDNKTVTPIVAVELKGPTPPFYETTSPAWGLEQLHRYAREICKKHGVTEIGGILGQGAAVKFYEFDKRGNGEQRTSTATNKSGAMHLDRDQKWVHWHLNELRRKYCPT